MATNEYFDKRYFKILQIYSAKTQFVYFILNDNETCLPKAI